ncbi:MAG: restriction endonuclease subunit S [Nitrococcus mobilis]|nr:restriction endonuclease subunit S [Nitrococcus mobilis]
MTGTAGQKRLPMDFVASNPFPLPPLAEQHRIVTKVDELMALCDRLKARLTDSRTVHECLAGALAATVAAA